MKKFLFVITCLAAACTPQISSPVPATESSLPTYAPIPTRSSTQIPTIPLTQTAAIIPSAESTPPAWVAEFSDPILLKTVDQYPAFQDDYTAGLNHGWFYLIDDNAAKPYFAHLEEDALILRIPDGKERRDVMAYSPKLAHENFVLSFDFKFGKTEPTDIFRFQFQQNEDQILMVDFSKNENASIDWNVRNHWQSASGVYDYFGPTLVNVILIMSGYGCAVYINEDPFAYLSKCRVDPIRQPAHEDLSFHLLSTTGHPATVTIDNVKIWDLDRIH